MKNVFFKPWVGKDYESGGMFDKKVLVVGESHYCGEGCEDCGIPEKAEECAGFTTKTVNDYLASDREKGRWASTFRKFERSMIGEDTDTEKSNEIWNSIAFYNYLQKALDGPREGGEWNLYKEAEQSFWEVMEELQPYVMIAWGVTRMYWNMPAGEAWERSDDLIIDNYHVRNGWYTLKSGKRVKAIWVYHPSSGYSWDWWNKVIKTVL